jgi:hypothetical protein
MMKQTEQDDEARSLSGHNLSLDDNSDVEDSSPLPLIYSPPRSPNFLVKRIEMNGPLPLLGKKATIEAADEQLINRHI